MVSGCEVNIRQQLFDTAVGVLSLLVVNMIAIAQKSHMAKLQRRQAEKELERRKMCSKMFTAAGFILKKALKGPDSPSEIGVLAGF